MADFKVNHLCGITQGIIFDTEFMLGSRGGGGNWDLSPLPPVAIGFLRHTGTDPRGYSDIFIHT